MTGHTPLLVGCPVKDRAWIAKDWVDHVEDAAYKIKVEPRYILVAPDGDSSVEAFTDYLSRLDRDFILVRNKQEPSGVYVRDWGIKSPNYSRMVKVRNLLLRFVRDIEPSYFLSIDSDILLNHQTLVNLMESIEEFDAVGGKVYMTRKSTMYPSYSNSFKICDRRDSDRVFPTSAIMALKLMTSKAYAIDYQYHDLGEDLGWSKACSEKNVTLGWDGRVANKHCMEQGDLRVYDKRCGY